MSVGCAEGGRFWGDPAPGWPAGWAAHRGAALACKGTPFSRSCRSAGHVDLVACGWRGFAEGSTSGGKALQAKPTAGWLALAWHAAQAVGRR